MRLSVFTDVLGRPFEPALDGAAELGFKYIDLRSKIGADNVDTLAGAAADAVAESIRRRGLAVGCVASWGVNAPFKPYEADAAHRRLMRDRLAHLAELAERLGACNVRVYGLRRPPDNAPVTEPLRADNAAFLGELAVIAGRRGRTLVIENEPPTVTSTCAEMGDLVRRNVPPNLRLNWDIVNGWRAGECPWAPGVFEKIAGYVDHIHVKGAKADVAGLFASMAVPGQDDVPHKAVFDKLKASGFDGIITIDPHYGQFAESDKLKDVAEADLEVVRLTKAYLESIL